MLGAAVLGRPARPDRPRRAAAGPAVPRANHDVIVSTILGTARGDLGLVTQPGRLIKINALDLPTVPATANAPEPAGRHATSPSWSPWSPTSGCSCLTTLAEDSLGLALGTAHGVVKRVNPRCSAGTSGR